MNPLLAALVQAGIITQPEAERINRSLDPDAARAWAEQQIALAVQGGLSQQQTRLVELVRRGNVTPAALDAFWAAEDARLWAAVRGTFEDVAQENAIAMAVRMGADDAMWRTVNRAVLDWVGDYYTNADAGAFGSIPNLNLTSRTQFAQVFEQWQRGEIEIGTTAEGLPQLVEALTPVFGPERSEIVASTEVTRIYTESTRAAAEQDEFITHYRFYAVADERVCEVCGPNHGRVIRKDERGFAMAGGGFGFPPLHPRCRCNLQLHTEATAQLPLPPEDRWQYSQAAHDEYERNRQAAQRAPNAARTLLGG